ncbi:MAG: hypothetical protein ACTSV0_09950 [Candidatus Freyarchaeota archaeon]
MSWKDSFEVKKILSKLLEGKYSPEKTQRKLKDIKLSGVQKIRIIENEIQERRNRLLQMDKELQTRFEAGEDITDEEKIAYERLETSIKALETQKILIQKEIDAGVEGEIFKTSLERAAEAQREGVLKTAEEVKAIEETRREITYEAKDVLASFDRKFQQRFGKKRGAAARAREAEKEEEERERERMYAG